MKVFLAAVETAPEHSISAARARVPYALTSYYYAKDKLDDFNWLMAMRFAKFRLIDSGAFTLRVSKANLVGETQGAVGAADVDYDAYLSEYIQWLKSAKRRGLADAWVEVDIGFIKGMDWVHRQRDAFIKAGLGSGLINVWHSDQDWDYWLYLLKEAMLPGRSGYVAIEGHQLNRYPLDYAKFLHEAYLRGVRVHCFRMTGISDLMRYPFYSVDSSTWLTPVTRGVNFQANYQGGVRTINRSKAEMFASRKSVWKAPILRRTSLKLRVELLTQSATYWATISDQLTNTWKERGIDWDHAIAFPKIKD